MLRAQHFTLGSTIATCFFALQYSGDSMSAKSCAVLTNACRIQFDADIIHGWSEEIANVFGQSSGTNSSTHNRTWWVGVPEFWCNSKFQFGFTSCLVITLVFGCRIVLCWLEVREVDRDFSRILIPYPCKQCTCKREIVVSASWVCD